MNPNPAEEIPQKKNYDAKQVDAIVGAVAGKLQARGEAVDPVLYDAITEPTLFNVLAEVPGFIEDHLEKILENSSKFSSLLGQTKRNPGNSKLLFGEEMTLPEVTYPNGQVRAAETGRKVLVDKLAAQGIDASYVLMYRLTMPSEMPKPEAYWTSDYHEVRRGLAVEWPLEKRRDAVILVGSLARISEGGLTQDQNDDQGLAVRRLSSDPMNQGDFAARFKAFEEQKKKEQAPQQPLITL